MGNTLWLILPILRRTYALGTQTMPTELVGSQQKFSAIEKTRKIISRNSPAGHSAGAAGRIRTDDLFITNELLYP